MCARHRKALFIVCVLAGISVLGIMGLTIKELAGQSSPLDPYRQGHYPQELPTELVRLAVREISQCELPSKAGNLRGILGAGRDTALFVRFDTDAEGIADVERTFSLTGSTYEHIDPNEFTHRRTMWGWIIFPEVTAWEKQLGTRLVDEQSIHSGRELKCGFGPHVFIDDEHATVYIFMVRK